MLLFSAQQFTSLLRMERGLIRQYAWKKNLLERCDSAESYLVSENIACCAPVTESLQYHWDRDRERFLTSGGKYLANV